MSMSIFETDPDVKELHKVEAQHKKRLNEINKEEKKDIKRIEKELSDKNKAEQVYAKVERETGVEKDKLIATEKEKLEKIKGNKAASETDNAKKADIIHKDTERKIKIAEQKLSKANKGVVDVYARIKNDENAKLATDIESAKNRAASQRKAADDAASVRTAELQNTINLKKENVSDIQALNKQNDDQLKEVHDLLKFLLDHSNNSKTPKPIADACKQVHKEALEIARSAAEKNDMQSLNDVLGGLKKSLNAAKKVAEHPEVESNITDLKAEAKTAAGKFSWKRLGSALSMLASAAVALTLNMLGAPATGGASVVTGFATAGVLAAAGIGLLFSSRQKGLSKSLSTLAEAAGKENNLQELPPEDKTEKNVSAPTKQPSQDAHIADVAAEEEVATQKLRR